MTPAASVRGVRMAFGGVEVVRGVDLDLFPGEVHAIVGENGAGKSTVAKILAGVHRPTGGHVELGGERIELQNPRHAIQHGIALIHQEPLTFPDLDVAENVFVGHQPLRGRLVDRGEMRTRTSEILKNLGVKLDLKARVSTLSVAEQQMVELASALSQDAQVLLMDETTASLTPKEVAELFAIVRRLRDQGRAIAFVSHHLNEVFEIADRITVLRDGEKVGEKRPKETTVEEIVRMMVGRDLASGKADHFHVIGSEPAVLSVHNLSVENRFVDVSFELYPGEIVGMAGLVGAGRTDVCQTLFGIHRPTSGKIEIGGKTVAIHSPRQAMRAGLAMVPEDRQHEGLLMSMDLTENTTLPLIQRLSHVGILLKNHQRDVTRQALDTLHTSYHSTSQQVRELSGGNQQKVVLAKWLMSRPRVLILDEPTRGVDVGAKAEVHRMIHELAEEGIAILMVSSDLPELLELSARVLVMRGGRLVAELSRVEATPDRVMLAATGQVALAG